MSESTEQLKTAVEGVIHVLAETGSLGARLSAHATALAEEAAGHGWRGIAKRMAEAAEALTAARADIDVSKQACGTAAEKLGLINDRVPAREVLDHLVGSTAQLSEAVTALDGAVEKAQEAKTAVTEIGQQGMMQGTGDLNEKLTEVHGQVVQHQATSESERVAADTYAKQQLGNFHRVATKEPRRHPNGQLQRSPAPSTGSSIPRAELSCRRLPPKAPSSARKLAIGLLMRPPLVPACRGGHSGCTLSAGPRSWQQRCSLPQRSISAVHSARQSVNLPSARPVTCSAPELSNGPGGKPIRSISHEAGGARIVKSKITIATEEAFRKVLYAVIKKDGSAFEENFQSFANTNELLAACARATDVAALSIVQNYKGEPSSEQLHLLAEEVAQDHAEWSDISAEQVDTFLQQMRQGAPAAEGLPLDVALRVPFVLAGFLLIQFQDPQGYWYEYLDRLWEEIEDLPG